MPDDGEPSWEDEDRSADEEMDAIPSNTIGPRKPDIQYLLDTETYWTMPAPRQPRKSSPMMAPRWQHVIAERERVGATHYLKLVPEAEKEVDS